VKKGYVSRYKTTYKFYLLIEIAINLHNVKTNELFSSSQVHGRFGVPDFQRALNDRRVFRVRERDAILDGTYLNILKFNIKPDNYLCN